MCVCVKCVSENDESAKRQKFFEQLSNIFSKRGKMLVKHFLFTIWNENQELSSFSARSAFFEQPAFHRRKKAQLEELFDSILVVGLSNFSAHSHAHIHTHATKLEKLIIISKESN